MGNLKNRPIRTTAALLSAITIGGCAAKGLREPVNLPLNVFAEAGHVHFNLEVRRPAKYNAIINIDVDHKAEDKLSSFARELATTLGNLMLRLPVQITVTRLDDRQIMLDRRVDSEQLLGSNRTSLYFLVEQIRLEPGEYEVDMAVLGQLKQAPEIRSSFRMFVRKL
jgi:hypothetical protein